MLELLLLMVAPEDEEKITILYHEYRDLMLYKVNSMVKNQYDAEEIVQNAFMGIAGNMKSIIDPYSKRSLAYCVKAAKNHALNFLNRKKKEPEMVIGEHEFILDEKAVNEYFEQIKDTGITDLLKKLPELYRDVLYFRYYEDMPIKDIAILLGRPAPTVKMQIHRGLVKMRELIKEAESNERATEESKL